MRRFPIILCLALLALGGCSLPKDPEGTSAKVQGKVLRVGLLQPEPDEADREAIKTIARAFDAEPQLVGGAAHDLVARLESGAIHVLVGGIPKDSPFSKKVGLSRPFGKVDVGGKTKKRVLAVRKGENGFLVRIERVLPETGGG